MTAPTPLVAVVMGSDSDLAVMAPAVEDKGEENAEAKKPAKRANK